MSDLSALETTLLSDVAQAGDESTDSCPFAARCPHATEICRTVEPQLTQYESGHLAACHHPQHVTSEEVAKVRAGN